jgi:hypothetical protein
MAEDGGEKRKDEVERFVVMKKKKTMKFCMKLKRKK